MEQDGRAAAGEQPRLPAGNSRLRGSAEAAQAGPPGRVPQGGGLETPLPGHGGPRGCPGEAVPPLHVGAIRY